MSSAAIPNHPEASPARPATRWPAARALVRSVTPWFASTHPVRWLRWLRDGMLAMILAAGLLCLLVTYQAHREITVATGRGALAITEVDAAYVALTQANKAVVTSFQADKMALIGPGAAYQGYITTASQDLILAARNNIAGPESASAIQFADGLLDTYMEQIRRASVDAASDTSAAPQITQPDPLALAEFRGGADLLNQREGIRSVLLGLGESEQQAVQQADPGSRWLGPGEVWWLLLAPLLVMLILVVCTSYALRRGFRRILSARHIAALVLTLGLVVLVAALNMHDGEQSRAAIRSVLILRTHSLANASSVDLQGQQRLNRMVVGKCPTPTTATCSAAVQIQPVAPDRPAARDRQATGTRPPGLPAVPAAGTGLAYSPWTLGAGLALAAGASLLAYAAYRPRLEEYRYRP
jgi:hypothetical protein